MEQERYLVKVEGNLIEYPFFHLGGRKDKMVKCKDYEFGEVVLENGLTVKRRLVVENYKDGIPGPYDQDVLMGILKIGTERNKLTEDIPLTVYEVAKELDDTNHWTRVRKSIERLVNTNYKSEQVVLVKESGGQYYLSDLFHILESARFLDKSVMNKGRSNEATKVRFNRFFITNFMNDYYKYIDLAEYLKLRSPIAKKLYMYLEKKKFEKNKYQVKLDNLAGILPLEVNEYYRIRSVLKKAHEKLIEKSIIKSFEFEKDKVVYHFPDKKEQRAAKKEKPENALVGKLVNNGVTTVVAENLVKKYDACVIEKQLEYLGYRKAGNAPGLLVKAIVEDWAAPSEHVNKKRQEEDTKRTIRDREIQRESTVRRKVFEDRVTEAVGGLNEEDLKKYNRMAEEQFKNDNPGTDMKFFGRGYRDSLIRKLIASDMGIDMPEE